METFRSHLNGWSHVEFFDSDIKELWVKKYNKVRGLPDQHQRVHR